MNWSLKWDIFIQKLAVQNEHGEYIYLKQLQNGLDTTIKIAVLGFIIGMFIGTLVATIRVAPKYKFIFKFLDKICSIYVAVFRGTPMVVQLLLAYYVVWPLISPIASGPIAETILLKVGGVETLVGIMTFGLNSGAYVSEIMRGGISSVDRGQLEAGRAVGLNYCTAMIKIVIPQAIKNILPTLGNEFITLIKETSVLSFITVIDLFNVLKNIATANQNYEFVVPYTVLGVIYIILVLIITLIVKIIEKILAKSDRRTDKPKKAKVRS